MRTLSSTALSVKASTSLMPRLARELGVRKPISTLFCQQHDHRRDQLAQLDENLGSLEVELSPEVLAAIETIYAKYPNPAP